MKIRHLRRRWKMEGAAAAYVQWLYSYIEELEAKRRGEPVAWPLASPEEADKGWTLDYRFIEQVERIASQHTDYTTSMEATEQVLIAANEVLRASQPAEPDKQHPDDVAVDAFAAAMKAKLKRAREEKGRGGWQDMSATELSAMLREHVEKGDPVDVANLAMMLSLNGQRIAPDEPVKVPSDVEIISLAR